MALVHRDTSATTGAHPADLVPAFSAFCTRIESFHLTLTIAHMCLNPHHGLGFYVVNINPLF
jgi:hypothetical protein